MAESSNFIAATKLTVVEALRDVYDAEFQALPDSDPFPRRIDIEYAQNEEDWPFILVQLRVNNASWTGIYPDESYDAPDPDARRVFRHGVFDGFLDLSVIALASQERDRMYDVLVKLFLMGRTRPATRDFFDRVENGELVGLTVMEGTVQPQGDAIGQGTPWAENALTYEASLRVALVGEFYADEYERVVPKVDAATAHESQIGVVDDVTGQDLLDEFGVPILPSEPPFGETDGKGEWHDI